MVTGAEVMESAHKVKVDIYRNASIYSESMAF